MAEQAASDGVDAVAGVSDDTAPDVVVGALTASRNIIPEPRRAPVLHVVGGAMVDDEVLASSFVQQREDIEELVQRGDDFEELVIQRGGGVDERARQRQDYNVTRQGRDVNKLVQRHGGEEQGEDVEELARRGDDIEELVGGAMVNDRALAPSFVQRGEDIEELVQQGDDFEEPDIQHGGGVNKLVQRHGGEDAISVGYVSAIRSAPYLFYSQLNPSIYLS